MAFTLVNSAGPTVLLQSSAGTTQTVGGWFRFAPHIANPTFQVKQTSSSVGATAGSTTYIELSNDGVTPIATKGVTVSLTGTTDVVSDGAALPSSLNGSWLYLRANLQSLTTSTAGSAGAPSVTVTMNAGLRT